jgi:hypothetical protein
LCELELTLVPPTPDGPGFVAYRLLSCTCPPVLDAAAADAFRAADPEEIAK